VTVCGTFERGQHPNVSSLTLATKFDIQKYKHMTKKSTTRNKKLVHENYSMKQSPIYYISPRIAITVQQKAVVIR
jgi:hypothetical protein